MTRQKSRQLLRRPIRNVSHSPCYFFTIGWTANHRCCSQHLTSLELLGLAFSRPRPGLRKRTALAGTLLTHYPTSTRSICARKLNQGLASINLLSLNRKFHVLTMDFNV